MRRLFVGVQANLRPIYPSLRKYLANRELGPFDQVMIRAPFGLADDSDNNRKLQFDDILQGVPDYIDTFDKCTFFIGSPYLANNWYDIASVIDCWYSMGCRSLCFEGLDQRGWNAQWEFCYQCCSIAGIEMFAEGIPRHTGLPVPLKVGLIIRDQRAARWSYRTDADEISFNAVPNQKHVIIRPDALKGKNTILREAFGKKPATLDELQLAFENLGVTCWRY